MKAQLILLLCPLWLTSQAVLSQTVNTHYLRRDETLQYSELALQFSAGCVPGSDPRNLGLGVDEIQFLDAASNVVFRVDVGTGDGRYYLGEGWYWDETWTGGLTMCWANASAVQSTVHCHVPSNSTLLRLVCSTHCLPITTTVRLNGTVLGAFDVPAYSGWLARQLVLPMPVGSQLDYTLMEGDSLLISAIDWIDGLGRTVATASTPCTLGTSASAASFPVVIPEDVGDFRVRFASPASGASKLRIAVNNSSALVRSVAASNNEVLSLEADALERQGDERTRDSGWGEDFNARRAGRVWTQPNNLTPAVESDGDALRLRFVEDEANAWLAVTLPESLPISEFPYLSVKLRASKGAFYYVRPEGFDDAGNSALLWFEEAPTDDRVGTGEWETMTVDLPKLVKMAGTSATRIGSIVFPLVKGNATNAALDLDWVRVHRGFLPNPEDRTLVETNFANSLDDDGDALTDKDDELDYQVSSFGRRLILCHYHPWFGTPFGATGHWFGWNGERMNFSNPDLPPVPMGIEYDPDATDPQHAGKRNICSVYYPLNFRDYPEYAPPGGGNYRYDLYGGVEQYDLLTSSYGRNEIELAQRYGIQGFVFDTGGLGSFNQQMENILACGAMAPPPFRFAALYDWYYRLPAFSLMNEKSDYAMALDLMFLTQNFGTRPSWLCYGSRPVVMPGFLSYTVATDKWKRVEQICVDPSMSSFDGVVPVPARQVGYGNRLVLQFARTERPPWEERDLAVVFDYIQLYDCDLAPLGRFDFGTSAFRAHLVSGWSLDETWADGSTWVWAVGTERVSTVEVALPSQAYFMEVRCCSFPSNNSLTMSLNGGIPMSMAVSQSARSYFFRLADTGLPPCPARAARPFALFLDSAEAAARFDGFASYGSYLRSKHCIVSDPQPTILTVGCGYDDRKIRYPGSCIDRESGALYRRQWESALDGSPDVVLVNTWNEWAEGTIIQPTVEFGYKYLELTLTYSLIFQGKMLTSQKPSAIDLTVKKYQVNADGQSEISLSATSQGTVVFTNLACDHLVSFQAFRDGSPFDGSALNLTNSTLTLNLLNTTAEYRLSFVRDAVPPVGSVRINDGAVYTDSTNVVIGLVASDNRGAVAGARYSNDGSNWTGWESYATNKFWTLTPGDGPKTVFVQFRDNIGNIATCSAMIILARCWFDSINRRPSGVVDLKFTGALGGRYRIDAATNLEAWSPLMMVTNTSRTITNVDQYATNSQRRFYRAVQQ